MRHIKAKKLAGQVATRLRAGLHTKRGKVLAAVVVLAVLWSTATFTAQRIADSVLIAATESHQVATVDGGIAIERKAIYSGTLSGDAAARVQAILNSGQIEPGPLPCPQTRLTSAPRSYQFWFYSHGILVQYIQAGDPGCSLSPSTLGVPALLIHLAPTPVQWDTIDAALGLAPLPPLS